MADLTLIAEIIPQDAERELLERITLEVYHLYDRKDYLSPREDTESILDKFELSPRERGLLGNYVCDLGDLIERTHWPMSAAGIKARGLASATVYFGFLTVMGTLIGSTLAGMLLGAAWGYMAYRERVMHYELRENHLRGIKWSLDKHRSEFVFYARRTYAKLKELHSDSKTG